MKKEKVTERRGGFKKQGKKPWGGGTEKTDERMVERMDYIRGREMEIFV